MSRVLINDDEAFEILDYLIKKDNSYEEYLAQKLFISMELRGKYSTYAKAILAQEQK